METKILKVVRQGETFDVSSSKQESGTIKKCNIELRELGGSCDYKSMTRASCRRWCSRHKNFVEPQGCCEDWRMSRQLQRLGAQKGIVKSREHLMAAHRKAIEN